jgi:tetratricopeptide (TPR) repeat protein
MKRLLRSGHRDAARGRSIQSIQYSGAASRRDRDPTPLSLLCTTLARFGAATLALFACLAAFGVEMEPLRVAIERQFRAGQVAQAMQAVERAIAAQPDDAGLRFLQGVMYAETHREADAMKIYERLVQDFPEMPEPYNNLAVLHAAQGHWDKARELLEGALRNDPNYLTAHRNLGDVYVRMALREYETAAGGKPADDALARRLKSTRELAAANAGR